MPLHIIFSPFYIRWYRPFFFLSVLLNSFCMRLVYLSSISTGESSSQSSIQSFCWSFMEPFLSSSTSTSSSVSSSIEGATILRRVKLIISLSSCRCIFQVFSSLNTFLLGCCSQITIFDLGEYYPLGTSLLEVLLLMGCFHSN